MTVELIAAERPSPAEIEAALAGALSVGESSGQVSERSYYDTFDGLLRAAGISYALDDAKLDLVALPDDVKAAIGVRALLEIARIRVVVETLPLLDELEKTVVRVAIESPSLLAATEHGLPKPLRTRIRLQPMRGYQTELVQARERLTDALTLSEPDNTLRDEAVLAAGGNPAGISAKVVIALKPEDRTDAAAAAVLMRLREVMLANLPGTLGDVDTEFLHDYRVALRKARSVFRELRPAFPPAPLEHLREELKWLQGATSDSRDLDVYELEFDDLRVLVPEFMHPDLEPLLSVIRSRRLTAHRAMGRELRGDRTKMIMVKWEVLLDGLPEDHDDDRPDASRPIAATSSERIRRIYRRMVKMGEAINPDTPPEDYHELRKQGKELRYLLELFGEPLHDEAVVKPMVKALKALQDVLGRHQDRDIQAQMIRTLGEEVSTLPGGAEGLMAMGVLIERLEADAAAARGEFASSFAQFASKGQQQLVKETFS